MSREVDERVVQMQFDNAQFERGTRQTMGTLEKLKQSLQFKGVEKGFERISSASQKVDFSEMTKALESIESKFSAVNVIAVTALTSITNKAIATGERLVKALSLDPIISGFQEYETQINAVQTILANTSSKGTTLDQVNAALDELNHYADLTIYNFTEMTRNIGTFTAAGVDLDTSVAAIKGIANLAAVSGSTSQQASTAMYQLSQALASGTVKLQDWNSVVNAGMGGQVFQDALKETARVHGVAIDSMIAKEGSFRETLSKGWLTSSILTETLQKFTGDLNEETLKSIGYTDEQIKKIMEMGKTANDAATKVKTFSQLKDTLAEALQSGWTQTWQTVIGDFEEAKELFTKFSDVFSDLINKSSEARNTVLEGGLNSGWQQLRTALGDSADFYSQMLEKVMLANGSISQKQIDDAGSFAKALQQGGVSAEQLQNGLDESTQQLQALSKLSDKELMAKGLDPTQVKALAKSFEEVNQKIADGSLNLDTYSKKIGELSGREHLIQSIWNIFEAIEKVVQPVMKAWQKMFSPVNAEQIYSIAEAIDSFTAKLSISDETADKIERTFSGVFAVLNVGRNALLAVGKVLGEVFNAASPLAGGFLSITAALGDCLVKMADAVNNSTVFKTVLDGIHWIVGKVSEGMQAFAGALTNVSNNVSVVFDPLKTLGEWFMSFINFIAPGLYTFGSSADKIFKEFGASAKEAFNSLDTEKLANVINSGLVVGILAGVKGFLKGAQELTSSAGDVIGSIKNTVNAVKDVLNSLGEAIDAWKQSKKAETMMTIAKAVAIMAASLTVLSMIKPERLAGGIGALTATIGELVGAFLLLDKFGGKTKSAKLGAMSVAMVAMASSALILAGAAAKLASIDSGKLVSSIVALGSIMGGLTAISVVLSKTGGKFMKGAMLAIAAIGVAGFALIKNWDKVKEWFANFGEWISNLFQNIAEGIGNFVSNLVEGIGNVFKKIWEVGKNIGQGLWKGVTSVASGIWNGIKGLGSWIVNGFKSIFGIHSPSTVMAELGAYMGQGFANGIASTEDGVNRSMDDMTSSALDIATNAAQMLYDVATGQETAEPIFTPVLNLSDYASPTSWAATQAYTPSAETAERVYRSNELAQRIGGNQNGVLMKSQSDNSDVVNAISQLGNRVDRMAESISKMKLVLDSGKTVGELAPKIDSNMGGRNILAERGVI